MVDPVDWDTPNQPHNPDQSRYPARPARQEGHYGQEGCYGQGRRYGQGGVTGRRDVTAWGRYGQNAFLGTLAHGSGMVASRGSGNITVRACLGYLAWAAGTGHLANPVAQTSWLVSAGSLP